jgi:hypothetical protein
MSDEPKKRSWTWGCAALALVLVGAVVGDYAGLYCFCRAGNDTG